MPARRPPAYRGRHAAPHTRLRRSIALGVIATSAVAAVLMGGTGPAAAQAPDVAGWWNAANVGDPAPAPPTPPDVKDDDLLVQGSNAAPAGAIGAEPASSQAVAAVAYDLGPTDLVGDLTLTIDGTPPPSVSVAACRATEPFAPMQNGPWSQAPAYDDKGCVAGKLTDDKVVFASMSKLVANARLAVVLVPGPLDRVVFKNPGNESLTVQHGTGVGAAAPPLGSGTATGPGAAGDKTIAPPASASGGGAPQPPPSTPDLPGASSATGTPDSGTPPVVAPQQQPGANPAAQSQPVAASSDLSTGARRAIALAVIALEVLGYLLLMRSPAAPAVPVMATAGGRLRPPDRTAGGGPRVATIGGVGRFRRERTGVAPHL